VHSIEELAAMARTKLGEYPPGYPAAPTPGYPAQPPGYPTAPPPGYTAPASGFPAAPASGFPTAPLTDDQTAPAPGFPTAPLTDDQTAPAPGNQAAPPPEYPAAPPGYPSAPWQGPPSGYTGQQRPGPRSSRSWESSGDGSSLGDDVADVVLTAATKFIGRAIGRRVKRAYNERVLPTLAVKQEAMLREQIAIAERHPDLRACLTDQVIFLAGGSRVLPMASVTGGLTVEQSDAVVAQLRDG
jgi:hypothetical protein